MINRSMPVEGVLPHVRYRHVDHAVVWLGRVFGFEEVYRHGEPGDPSRALVRLGAAVLMLEKVREPHSVPAETGHRAQYLTVFVDDVDAVYARVRAEGVAVVEEINETVYGERQFGVEDLDGHGWLVSEHVRDVSPEEWGAQPG